jgi:hypothetical protein
MQMASNPERIGQLKMAAEFCLFDKKLVSSGNSSIVWGLLNALFGASFLTRGNNWGAVSLVLGLALIAVGIYERKVRDPKVIIVSAATLAVLALWNFALIALSAFGNTQSTLGGRRLYWAIAQAWGAWATWKTYSTYKTLHEKADPSTVQQMREYLAEVKKTKPEQSLDLVEFESGGFPESVRCYRLKPVEDLYFVAWYKKQFGSLQLEGIDFVLRQEVLLTPKDGTWSSKKIKTRVQLGPLMLEKVSITPEMAMRINPAARAMALGNT